MTFEKDFLKELALLIVKYIIIVLVSSFVINKLCHFFYSIGATSPKFMYIAIITYAIIVGLFMLLDFLKKIKKPEKSSTVTENDVILVFVKKDQAISKLDINPLASHESRELLAVASNAQRCLKFLISRYAYCVKEIGVARRRITEIHDLHKKELATRDFFTISDEKKSIEFFADDIKDSPIDIRTCNKIIAECQDEKMKIIDYKESVFNSDWYAGIISKASSWKIWLRIIICGLPLWLGLIIWAFGGANIVSFIVAFFIVISVCGVILIPTCAIIGLAISEKVETAYIEEAKRSVGLDKYAVSQQELNLDEKNSKALIGAVGFSAGYVASSHMKDLTKGWIHTDRQANQ